MGRHREFNEGEVLERAMKVFWRHGYTAASITEICDEMGLNPGSIYNAFGNKHGLFIAVIKQYLDDVANQGLTLIESKPTGLEGIQVYFEYVADGIVNGNRRWGCLGTNSFVELSDRDPDIRNIVLAHLQRLEHGFQHALERDGIDSAKQRAGYLVCMAQGFNVMAKTAPSVESLRDTTAQIIASLRSSMVT